MTDLINDHCIYFVLDSFNTFHLLKLLLLLTTLSVKLSDESWYFSYEWGILRHKFYLDMIGTRVFDPLTSVILYIYSMETFIPKKFEIIGDNEDFRST